MTKAKYFFCVTNNDAEDFRLFTVAPVEDDQERALNLLKLLRQKFPDHAGYTIELTVETSDSSFYENANDWAKRVIKNREFGGSD